MAPSRGGHGPFQGPSSYPQLCWWSLISLVAESILPSTVRALPGDGIAGHAPYIFFHTVLTDTESTPAPPAEGKLLAAAVAHMMALFTVFSSIGRSYFRVFHGCCFIALLLYILKILMQTAMHVNLGRLVHGVPIIK